MENSLFEKIISREISADIVWESEDVLVFRDIAPQAPTHLLAIPKRHFERIAEFPDQETELLGKVLIGAKKAAANVGLAQTGYRLVINNGLDAGETVPHLHVHILGGRKMQWPPG
ncbi:MAG: histidine triad nucleotide-binding protein [Verrucomicrobiota bacterium]